MKIRHKNSQNKANSHLYFNIINKKLPKYKCSQSGLIVSVLIILIVVISFLIIYNVIVPLVQKKSQGVQVDSFITDLKIGKASVGSLENLKVTLSRGNAGQLDGIKFVFYDENGKSAFVDRTDVLNKLETKEYYFSPFGNLTKIVKIEVYPIVKNNLGIKKESQTTKELSPSLSLSWSEGDASTIDGLSFNKNMGISFWVFGNSDKFLLKQNYMINLVNKKVVFSYGANNFTSFGELTSDKNHVVVSIGQVSTMYINGQYSGASESFGSFQSSGNLTIGDIDNLMIFNKSLDLNSVSGLYNSQVG